MKKIIVLILTTLLLFSCKSTPNYFNTTYNLNDTQTVSLNDPQTISLNETQTIKEEKTQTDSSSQNLAKGIAAENEGNYVEALDFYFKTTGDSQATAQQNIQLLLNGTIPTDNLKEKAEFYKKQQEKWKIIFNELEQYLEKELPIFIYDFSSFQDSIN